MPKFDKSRSLPIYLKAEQILKLTEALIQIVPKEDEFLQETSVRFMMQDALIIAPKIAGAEAADLYDLRMENAAIIRKAARDLYVHAGSLRYHGIKNVEYIELLRNEIDEFRLLFIDWVAGFDVWNYIKDDWGLFNPPGVNAHDKDPDTDIPFDPDDFFNFDPDNFDPDDDFEDDEE
jgi:hypothetical protein